MEWTDNAIVLTANKHGESSLIVSLLTEHHGRHAGLVRGGAGRRNRGIYQPGNLVNAQWRARLPEHLGAFTCELTNAKAATLLDSPLELSVLASACAIVEVALPERESHPSIYKGLLIVLNSLDDEEVWPTVYVKWEIGLLQELGFGLDLTSCAATGNTEDLIYVSPKSGRAVSREAGEPYRDKLLQLPGFLSKPDRQCPQDDLYTALKLTGYFLERHAYGHADHRRMPQSRTRLLNRVRALSRVEFSDQDQMD